MTAVDRSNTIMVGKSGPETNQPVFADQSVRLYVPLVVSLSWLIGTFALFLLVGQRGLISNVGQLTFYISSTVLLFTFGYVLTARSYRRRAVFAREPNPARERLLVILGALHYLFYGVALMLEYGVLNTQAISSALTDPAGAYSAKFGVYERQIALQTRNPALQILTLLAPLAAPLVPLLVVRWRALGNLLRALALSGLGAFLLFFLATGTQVGLGATLIYFFTAVLILRGKVASDLRTRRRRRMVSGVLVILGIAFIAYMSYNQAERQQTFGISDQYEPSPIVASLAGDEMARGFSAAVSYPTHGYQGLAYNLQTPPVWTGGRGATPALDSYFEQYGIAESVRTKTYPARTEARTGWPSGMYWSTVYPWLASDLTFTGAALFMFVVGAAMARWWVEAVAGRDVIAMLLLAQSLVFVFFVPANNQIGLSRPNLLTFVALLVVYIFSRRTKTRTISSRTDTL